MSNKFADLGFEPVETVDAFDSAFKRTLGFEGGYTVDHAGPTNFGVTQDTYDNWRKKQGLPTKPVRAIDTQEAKQLYKQEYFDKPGFSKLPANVAGVLFDYGVNAGTPRAAMALQKAVGASPDGVIGPKTLNKVNEFVSKNGEQPLLQKIVDQRSQHIDTLIKKNPAKYKKFENGWKNRINAIKSEFKLSDLNPFSVTEASADEVTQNDFADLGFEPADTPTETLPQSTGNFDDLGFTPEQAIPQLSADKNFDRSAPLPEKMQATQADFDFFTQNLADKLATASSGQTVPEMIESKNKLNGIIMRAPMLATLPVAPIASAIVEGFTQAKNLIVSSVKKEKYSPIEIRVLNELLPKETPTAVRIAAIGGEALTDVALLGGLSNLAKEGLLKDTIKEIGMKLERSGYGTGQKTINMDVVKEAARGSTLDIEAERWLKAKLGDVKPKNNIGTTTPEKQVAGIAEPPVAPKTDQPRTVDVSQPEIIKAPPPSKEILAEAQKPMTPVERAAQHGEVVGIDAKSGLPVIDTSVKPAEKESPILPFETKDGIIQPSATPERFAEIVAEAKKTKEIKSVIEQAGGKFKAITNQENSLYEDEPTIYYDTPSGSTQTIRPSQLNIENVKDKINKFENIKPVVAAQTSTPNLTPKQTEALAPSTENIINTQGGDYNGKSQETSKKGNEENVLIPQGQKVETPKAPVSPLHAEALKYKTAEEFVKAQTTPELLKGVTIEGFDSGRWRKIGFVKDINNGEVNFYNSSNPKGYQTYSHNIDDVKKWLKSGAYRIKDIPEKYQPGKSIFEPSAKEKKANELTAIFNEAHGIKPDTANAGKASVSEVIGQEEQVNREALAKEYADSLEQPLSDFHKRFINQVLDKDTSNLLKVLAQGAGRNLKSKKMFTKITGIKLPTTIAGIKDTLYEYTKAEKLKPPEVPAKPVKLSKEEQLQRMKNARAEKTLQGKVRFDGKVVTKKQMIDELMSKASTPTVRVTDDENALKRLLDERRDLGRNGMQNINAKKIDEINQKIDAGVKKTEYFIETPSGSYYVVNKTEYDYAKSIKSKAFSSSSSPASLKPPTVSQIKAASSPQEFEKRIEQLNKFGQANAILRRTAKLKNAAGRFSPKENVAKIDEGTYLNNSDYMTVLGHELGHAIEYNVTGKISQGTSGKTGFDLFGKDADHAKIRQELIAVSEDLVGKETMLAKPEYYFQSTELIARFFEKMIFSPGNLKDLAPTAVAAIELQAIKQPIIQEFLLAATGGIDKGTPKFALLRDMRETYQKHLGKFVGNRAYDQEMVYRAMKERGKIVLEKFINDKMKMVKDSPETLFRAAESIKISRGGIPEFGTRDFATAHSAEEEKALIDAGYERLKFTVAEDGKLYTQYAKQRYTPDEAKLIFDSLSENGKKLILDFTAERKEAKDFFNREVIKDTYKIQSQLEGWVHHYFEDRPGSTVVGGQKFKAKVAGSRKQRTGTEGYVEDFKKAMTKALVDLEGEKVYNEFIPKLLATVTKPLGEGQTPDPGWVEVVGNIKSGVGLPIEKRATVIDSATGERVPMKQSRYQMPKEIYERYKMWRGLIDEATTAVRIVNDLNRYWRINILTHPGTSATNFISGGIQFSSKILTDFYREVLTGKLSMPDTKANISSMLKVLLPRGWMDAPDWVYGSDLSNFYGEFMKKKSPISASIDTYGNKALVLFGTVERYWKKVIMTADGVADLKSLNEMTPEGLRVPTKEEAEMIAAINESVDLYAYDYDNVPQWLEQHQKSVVGQAIKPFAKYPYKYAKQILNMVGGAFDQSLPVKDRMSKILALATIVSAYAAYSANRRKKQKTPVADKSLDIPARLQTRGRVFIGTDEKGREIFVRVSKYPFFNLTEAGMQFVDGNWSTGVDVLSDMLGSIGPAASVGLMAFNYRSKYTQYEKPEVILGDNLATFLPGYRILNDVSRALDPFQRKQETFGQTFTQIIPTTDQALQEKLHGKIRTERVPIEGNVGLEPVGSRTTVDVPLENVKEDILLSLFTGVYRTRLDPKVVEAYIIRKQKNLDKKTARDARNARK